MRGLKACVAALALWAGAAFGHSGPGGDVRTVLGELPSALSGVTVQLRSTLAPQLLVKNDSTKRLEILDPAGRAFIRIGPDGVFGDHNAAAWYNSYSTARLTVPEKARDPSAPPDWRRVRDEPAFGWFDPRLATHDTEVPHQVKHAGEPADFGSWQIPVRVAGSTAAIDGAYRYDPRDRPQPTASLTGSDLPQWLRVALVPGMVDALLLENRSEQTVTVLGLHDEPYLRIGPQGVDANIGSRTWREWGRGAAGAPSADSDQVRWKRIAGGSRYTWLEPRSRSRGDDNAPHVWDVPLRVGDTAYVIRGVTASR